jgi:hypothetical protein
MRDERVGVEEYLVTTGTVQRTSLVLLEFAGNGGWKLGSYRGCAILYDCLVALIAFLAHLPPEGSQQCK